MPNERINYFIGLQFAPGDAVGKAASTADRIKQIMRSVNSQASSRFGPELDPAKASKFTRDLQRALQAAYDVDLKAAGKAVRPIDRKIGSDIEGTLLRTEAGKYGPFRKAINELTAAEVNLQKVRERALVAIGKTKTETRGDGSERVIKGFPSGTDRTEAVLKAENRVIKATDDITKAKQNYLGEIARSVQFERRVAASAAEIQRVRVVPYPDAGRDTKEGIARNAVNDAQLAVVAKYRTLAAVNEKIARGDLLRDNELTNARLGLSRALNAQANAVQRLANIQAAPGLKAAADAETKARAVRREQETRGAALAKEIDAELARQAEAQKRKTRAAEAQAALTGIGFGTAAGLVGTGVGRAEEAVAAAQRRRAVAEEQMAEVLRRADAGELSKTQALKQGEAAMRARTAAVNAEAAAERNLASAISADAKARSTGRLQAFGEQFGRGFRGASDRPYGEQIGQAFKFSVFYGTAYKLLFALTQTFQQTLQEGIAFQEAITELKISSGRANEELEGLTQALGSQAVQAGFAPSQGVLVGARSLGLYGVTAAQGGTQAEQDRVAEISARVVSRMATGTDRTPVDLQSDIAAITQAFGQGAEGQFRAADLDAYMSKFFGVGTGQTLQAVSESATVARAAGFDQEQASAIAAQLMSRTGQTAPAVAGFMAQIFSRGGEGSLTNVAGRYGIDPALELADQIEQLAGIYKTASSGERTEIAAAFGRGKVQNAAIALLQDYSSVQRAAERAKTEAGGAADEAFQERIKNIGGQIAVLNGVLKDFASALGDSGLLHVLGLGIVVFRELVESATGLLRIWNSISGVTRTVIASLIALGLAARTTAGRQILGAATSGFYTSAGAGGGRHVATAGAQAARASLASVASTLINPVTVAIGGLYAVGQLKASSERMAQAQDLASKTMREYSLTPGVSTAGDYQARAAALAGVASQSEEAASGFWARVDSFLGGGGRERNQASAEANRAEAERLIRVAGLVEEAAKAVVAPEERAIKGFDTETLKAGLDSIDQAGGTASTQLAALNEIIYGTAKAAERAKAAFDPALYSGEHAGNLRDILAGSLKEERFAKVEYEATTAGKILNALPQYGARGQGPRGESFAYKERRTSGEDLLLEAIEGSDIEKRLREQVAKFGDPASLGRGKLKQIATSVVGDIPEQLFEGEDVASAREEMVAAVLRFLTAEHDEYRRLLKPNRMTSEELKNLSTAELAVAEQALARLSETDVAGRRGTAEATLARQEELIRAATRRRRAVRQFGGGFPGFPDLKIPTIEPGPGATEDQQENLDRARRMVAQAQFAEFEQLRKVAQQNAKSKAQVAAVGNRYLRQEIDAAVAGGDRDLLATIIAQAGRGAVVMARDAIMTALKAAKAAAAAKNLISNVALSLMGPVGVVVGIAQNLADPAVQEALGMLEGLETSLSAAPGESVYDFGTDVPGLPEKFEKEKVKEKEKKAKEDVETARERAAARRAAYAIRSESPIAQARAEIATATAAMAEAEKGSVAYYDALGSFFAARNSLTDAILEHKHNLGLLRIDATNPLRVAELAVRDALRKLRSDRGKGADVRAADKVALQEAQANVEATRFSQRLSNVQTAEQLGRISHARYIKYLENESARLNRIKNRTYQQQQQLNEIDLLLKSAADSAQGQFNFGDINLPKPYEVKRYIKAQLSPAGADVMGINQTSTVTINIDGADTGKVREIIDTYVGQSARTTTTAARRR